MVAPEGASSQQHASLVHHAQCSQRGAMHRCRCAAREAAAHINQASGRPQQIRGPGGAPWASGSVWDCFNSLNKSSRTDITVEVTRRHRRAWTFTEKSYMQLFTCECWLTLGSSSITMATPPPPPPLTTTTTSATRKNT
eukprot:scaffold31589_cov20-Tisochrysis_lutea.AAC.2